MSDRPQESGEPISRNAGSGSANPAGMATGGSAVDYVPQALPRTPTKAATTSNIQGAAKSPGITRFLLLVGLTFLGLAGTYLCTLEYSRPDCLRTYGVVGNATAVLNSQSPSGVLAPGAAWLLRHLVTRNKESQTAALHGGAVDSSIKMLQSNQSAFTQRQAALLLQELMWGNGIVKDTVIKQGGLDELINLIKADKSEGLTAKAAQALAIFAADSNNQRKKSAAKAGAVAVLLDYLEGGKASHSQSHVNAVWALANLAADSPAVQAALLELGGPDLFLRLLEKGLNHRMTQPALHATSNIAAQNQAAQDVLRDAGGVNALVKLIAAGVEGHKSRASEPFHAEILEHVAELQRNDPSVRSALAEVGGLEELLGIIEAGAMIKPLSDERSKQLVPIEEEEGGKDDELHSIRRLVRDLQDEVDTEAGLLPDVKVPSLLRGPSGARILHKLQLGSKQSVAALAAWALSNVVANNQASQDAAREAGAVDSLVKLLESAEDAFVAKGALGAISALVKNSPANKAAVREAHGVEGLVKLLASNPADKEVLQATAQALKSMTADRSAAQALRQSGFRWLRVLGRQGSLLLSEKTGIQLSPAAASAAIVICISSSVLCTCLFAISAGLKAGRRTHLSSSHNGKKTE